MDEIRCLLLGLILHLIVISESRVIVPRDLSNDRLFVDEGVPILLNPLDKDKKFNLKPPIRNPPTEDDDFNLYDYEGVNEHHSPPFDSEYNEFDKDKIDDNLPGTKPERFPFDANDEELEGKPLGKDKRDKPSDDDLKETFGNEDSDIFGNNDKDLESSFDEDKPILKYDDEEIGDNDAKEPDEDYGNKEHKPENEKKPGEERKDEEENPEPEDEVKPGDERKDEDEDHKPEDKEKPDENNEDEDEGHKPEDKEKPDENNEDEEKKQEPEDVEKPDEEKKDEEEELESKDDGKIDETKGDGDDDEEEKNVPEEPIDDGNKEEEVPKGIDEESLDKEDDSNIDKGIHEGEEAGFFSGGSIFDTPFFNLEQVKKYFSKLDRALGHVFRQTLDEAYLLNGTYANTTEEEVEIDGKKYIVTKSVIKGSDNHSSLYVESLSTKGNDTEVIKDIEIRNVSHT